MNQVDQSGKGPVRKLGRGLSALLGNPVQIQVPQAHTPRAAQTNALRVDDPLVGTPRPTGGAEINTVAPPALIVDMEAERFASPSPTIAKHSGLRDLPIEQIIPNRRQPRTDFDESSLQALAVSIKQAGLMQPIMVRPTQSGFELVAGERRWRAAKLLGLPTIPAVVRDLTDQSAAELALIENIQREDLNPMERALALRRLAMDFGMTHQQIAERVGLDRASVSNLLRLSELDHATADLVRSGRLTQGHAKALLAIGELGERAELAAKSVAQDWSVRELERQVQHAQARVMHVHVCRCFRSRRQLEHDLDPIDHMALDGLRDQRRRRDEPVATTADRLAQAAIHMGHRSGLQGPAELEHRPAAHCNAGQDRLGERLFREAEGRDDLHAPLHVLLADHAAHAAIVVPVAVGVDDRRDGPVAAVAPIQCDRSPCMLRELQWIDHDEAGVTFDERDIGQ